MSDCKNYRYSFVKTCGTTDAIHIVVLLIKNPFHVSSLMFLEKTSVQIPNYFIGYNMREHKITEPYIKWTKFFIMCPLAKTN